MGNALPPSYPHRQPDVKILLVTIQPVLRARFQSGQQYHRAQETVLTIIERRLVYNGSTGRLSDKKTPSGNLCKTEGLEQMDVALVDFTAG
jgi:hypothetical protein